MRNGFQGLNLGHTLRCSAVGGSRAPQTLDRTASVAAHSPVSRGGCHPERLTVGLNASSGGVPSVCRVQGEGR